MLSQFDCNKVVLNKWIVSPKGGVSKERKERKQKQETGREKSWWCHTCCCSSGLSAINYAMYWLTVLLSRSFPRAKRVGRSSPWSGQLKCQFTANNDIKNNVSAGDISGDLCHFTSSQMTKAVLPGLRLSTSRLARGQLGWWWWFVVFKLYIFKYE